MGTKQEPGAYDCYEHAEPDEPMFVLIARDRTAPAAVRWWAANREIELHAAVASGAGVTGDEVLHDLQQINEARQCADAMEAWRKEHRP